MKGGFCRGRVSGSDFLCVDPVCLYLTRKTSMQEFGWLLRWLNGQQLGSRSRSDGGASLSCNLETNPSIDHIKQQKFAPPSSRRTSFLPPTVSSPSTSAPRPRPRLKPRPSFSLTSALPFDQYQYFLLQSPSSVILQSPQSNIRWPRGNAVGFRFFFQFLYCSNFFYHSNI